MTLEESFWAHVAKTEACWNWTGSVVAKGYGSFSHHGEQTYAHRASYEIHKGAIPNGMVIDHVCHNTLCVNPGHLRAATYKQNGEHRIGASVRSKSGVRGVNWDKDRHRWVAYICHNRQSIFCGRFENIADAEAAVIAKRNELFTHNDLDRQPVR